jgi:recombination protein RecA
MPEIGIIVIDSVAALTSEDELADTKQLGRLAALMSQELKKLVAVSGRESPTVIMINQLRDNVGVMWGDKQKSPGGRALGFYSSVQIRVSQLKKIKDESTDQIRGIEVQLEAKKNKVGLPYRKVSYILNFKTGISKYSGLLPLMIRLKLVKKGSKNGLYTYEGEEFKMDGSKLVGAEGVKVFSEIVESNKDAIVGKLNEDW